MLRLFTIASLAAFVAVGAFAAPRDAAVPTVPTTTEDIAGNPNDDQGSVSNYTKPLGEKSQGCGCGNKPKKR